jgi:tetrahydromethanopterin S-methyltransferase subunit C
MSVAAGGPARGGISPNNIIMLGAVGGLVGIYLTYLNVIMGTDIFSFLGAIGAILAAVWGADAVRRVCSYGLGTGVPSIGMLALGMGIVAAIFGLALPESDIITLPPVVGPVISFIVAAIIGWIIGIMANKILKMNIPIMEQSMVEIAGAGSLVMVGLSTAIAGGFDFQKTILPGVVDNGYIALIFIGGAMAMLHPFNACLGPDETQYRTLRLGVAKGALMMTLAGIASLTELSVASSALTIIVGLIIWIVFFKKYFEAAHHDAYLIAGTGLLPTEEELE